MTLPLKSALLAGAAVVALCAAGAGTARAATVFDGPYVGGWVGYYQFHPHFSGEKDDLVFGFTPRSFDGYADNVMPNGVQGGGFGGYGFTFADRFYVGGEAEISDTSASTTNQPIINQFGRAEGTGKVSAGLGYGAGVRLGYIPLPNWLVYGKVGWGAQRYKISIETAGEFLFPQQGTKTLNGIRYGAGTELALPGLFGNSGVLPLARLEWVHTTYDTGALNGGFPAVGQGQVFRVSPNDDSVRVGLVIEFGGP